MGLEAKAIGDIRQAGRDVIGQARASVDRYLALANDKPNPHQSEYVGPQMLGGLQRYALDRYFSAVASGSVNAEHGYDEDPITQQVIKETKELTGTEAVVLVPTGTAANLDLVSSFTSVRKKDGPVKYIASSSAHTFIFEGDMLQKAGIREEDCVKIPPRDNGVPLIEDIKKSIEGENNFIFHITIPSDEGVVPPLTEIREMIELVHERGGAFLVDGARLTNALVHWNADLGILNELGVDGFTLGTSKKGGLAEAVCVSEPTAAEILPNEAKSFGHISSKSSPLAIATGLFLTTDLWRVEAESENTAASRFAEISTAIGIKPEFPVNANGVFIKLTEEEREELKLNPNFGETYADYGPDTNVSRILFTGLRPPEYVLSAAAALAIVRNVPADQFLLALTEEERNIVTQKKIEVDYLAA